MHPFYGSSSQFLGQESTWWIGLASMAMYLIFWGVVVVFAVRIGKKYLGKIEEFKKKEDTAISILRERYARGEIDFEEFKKIKEDLEKNK